MKKLLILPLLALLSGCVTYYYPETALEDGVYYAEDDPSYTVYSDSYVGVGYYPWYSLDYFYLGYYPYPRHRVSYVYPGGLYLGFSYGFSPWYYPSHYYGYYSPWYASYRYYPYYPAWRPYGGYYAHHYGDRHHKKHHYDRYPGRDRHDRYAGRDRGDRDQRDRKDYSQSQRSREQGSHHGANSVRRYVSTGRNGERGVVVRNRETSKVGKSKLQIGQQRTVSTAESGSHSAKAAQPAYRVNKPGSEVRYGSGSKQSRSHTEPVRSNTPSVNVGVSPPTRSTQRSAGEVRYRASSKPSPSRTEPVASRPPLNSVTNRSSSSGNTRVAGKAPQPSRAVSTRSQASNPGKSAVRSRTPNPSSSSRSAPRPSQASNSRSSGKKSSSRRDDRR